MIHLFFCPQMTETALRIHTAHPKDITLGRIDWSYFQDGFPNLRIENAPNLRNRDVAFLGTLTTPGEMFAQLAVLFELPRYAVRSFKLILPYFPTGTMERVEEEGQIATAATLARLLSDIPLSMSGPAQIVIYDIHALQERFYFSDSVIPRLETAVHLLKEEIQSLPDVSIAFPDEGAWKRFGRLFSDFPQIVCLKARQGDRRGVLIKEGDPRDRHVLIVDDLIMSGGTLIECKNVLLEKGANCVSAFATHGVFPDRAWLRLENEGFQTIWITDSCPAQAEAVYSRSPFQVISLARDIARILLEPLSPPSD
ncbi:phosphoribosyltransferase family protein [Desulfonatronum parangueonense]